MRLVTFYLQVSGCDLYRTDRKSRPMSPALRTGLGKHTDRDQRSWVLMDDRKKYFATDRKPKKYFPKSKTRKRRSSHDIMRMKNCAY